MLSGKYLKGARPEGSRWTMTQRQGLIRASEQVDEAVSAYQAIAQKHGLTVAQLALLWCDQVHGVTSTIIGATSMENLRENIAAFGMTYEDELAADVAAALKRYALAF